MMLFVLLIIMVSWELYSLDPIAGCADRPDISCSLKVGNQFEVAELQLNFV